MTEEQEANRPDTFWPWKALNIDEAEWDYRQAERSQQPPGTYWWTWWLVGGVIGLLLALLS